MTVSSSIPQASNVFIALADDLKAGQPVLRSLRRIEGEFTDTPISETIRLMADDIESGGTLSEALGKHPQVFDEVAVLLVKGGEEAGMLDRLLPIVADYIGK